MSTVNIESIGNGNFYDLLNIKRNYEWPVDVSLSILTATAELLLIRPLKGGLH